MRNAIASLKAVYAACLALHSDGSRHVSLDKAIKTIRETGADMMTKYKKETSRSGLAVREGLNNSQTRARRARASVQVEKVR